MFNPAPFGSNDSPTRNAASGAVRFSSNNPSTVTPALDAMRRRAKAQQNNDGLVLLMDTDLSSERARIRANVTRSNGERIQAYGWSIASNGSDEPNASVKSTVVPVPTYCRPLSGDDVGMKIWCATAVDLSGGEAGFPGNGTARHDSTSVDIAVKAEERMDDSDDASGEKFSNYSSFERLANFCTFFDDF